MQLFGELSHVQKKLNNFQHEKVELEKLIQVHTEVNAKLNSHIQLLTGKFINRGKKLGDCKKSQTKAKVSMLKERVEKALWFAKSFGVSIDVLKVSDHTGKTYDLSNDKKCNMAYEKLPEEEKEKVKKLLFLLDSFGISDGAYHELTVQNDTMIKSYLIQQCRNEMNSLCTIT